MVDHRIDIGVAVAGTTGAAVIGTEAAGGVDGARRGAGGQQQTGTDAQPGDRAVIEVDSITARGVQHDAAGIDDDAATIAGQQRCCQRRMSAAVVNQEWACGHGGLGTASLLWLSPVDRGELVKITQKLASRLGFRSSTTAPSSSGRRRHAAAGSSWAATGTHGSPLTSSELLRQDGRSSHCWRLAAKRRIRRTIPMSHSCLSGATFRRSPSAAWPC